jgi:dihydroorotase
VFIDRIFSQIVRDFPGLRTVFEHITTADAVDFVAASGPNVAATITPQHLHTSRNDMLVGGIRPHLYCLPIVKRERHRLALRTAATSGNPKFFLGTDTAPHAIETKETSCGCAGIFNAPFAIESYAQVFDEENALDQLEAFASLNGPAFYRLPVNDDTITLVRGGETVPTHIDAAGTQIVPFHAGETLGWRLAAD